MAAEFAGESPKRNAVSVEVLFLGEDPVRGVAVVEQPLGGKPNVAPLLWSGLTLFRSREKPTEFFDSSDLVGRIGHSHHGAH